MTKIHFPLSRCPALSSLLPIALCSTYIDTGVDSVKVTGDPDILTQIVRGSLPIFSVVKPWVLVTDPGTVTGIVAEQVLPLVLKVTPVIVFAVGFVLRVKTGVHASLAMRLAKDVEKSSCF